MKTQRLPGWGIEKVENEACVKIKSRVPTSPSCPTCSLRRKIAVGGAEQLPKYAQYFLSSESENPSELHSYLGALRKSRYRVNRQEDEAWPETKHPGTALVGYRVGCHSGPLDCPLCGLSDHSLTLFLLITGLGWVAVYRHADPESKWGQVAGNLLSEWTQILALVIMTKRLMETHSKESRK